MPKFHALVLLSLTYVIANRLNSKYLRRAVIAVCLSHLITDVHGGIRFESLRQPILNFLSLVNVCLEVFLTCCSQRVEDKENNKEFTALLSSLS